MLLDISSILAQWTLNIHSFKLKNLWINLVNNQKSLHLLLSSAKRKALAQSTMFRPLFCWHRKTILQKILHSCWDASCEHNKPIKRFLIPSVVSIPKLVKRKAFQSAILTCFNGFFYTFGPIICSFNPMIHENVRMTNLSVHQIKKLVFVMLCLVVLWKRSHYSDIILRIGIQCFYAT